MNSDLLFILISASELWRRITSNANLSIILDKNLTDLKLKWLMSPIYHYYYEQTNGRTNNVNSRVALQLKKEAKKVQQIFFCSNTIYALQCRSSWLEVFNKIKKKRLKLQFSKSEDKLEIKAKLESSIKVGHRLTKDSENWSWTLCHCTLPGCWAVETQEHLEFCAGMEFERWGLDLAEREGQLIFWREWQGRYLSWQ